MMSFSKNYIYSQTIVVKKWPQIDTLNKNVFNANIWILGVKIGLIGFSFWKFIVIGWKMQKKNWNYNFLL